jgi:hypothetical protein
MDPSIRRTHFPDKVLLVPIHVRDERLEQCKVCPNNKESMCVVNYKPIYAQATKRSLQCPLGFWSSYYGS